MGIFAEVTSGHNFLPQYFTFRNMELIEILMLLDSIFNLLLGRVYFALTIRSIAKSKFEL